jgi:hypothetical protein
MPSSPTFAEPWEAQTLALAVTLSERGVFTWRQWTEAVGAHGDWLTALEHLVCERGLGDTLAAHREAWRRADERTPHGTPIELTPGDFYGRTTAGESALARNTAGAPEPSAGTT